MGAAGTVVILAAGQGTRMRMEGPKVLQPLCGRPMLGYVLDQALDLDPERIVLVTGHGGDAVQAWARAAFPEAPLSFVTQAEQRGTGHAVLVALDEIRSGADPVVVLYGDMPLLTGETLRRLCAAQDGARATVTTMVAATPRGFGRVLRREGAFAGVVEERDASPEQLAIREVNVGVYAFRCEDLERLLPQLSSDNSQGELYLTDLPAMLLDEGHAVDAVVLHDEREGIGVNDLGHLSEARSVIQERLLAGHMAAGVFVEDPASTYVDWDVEIGAGTHLLPCTVIRSGVRIGRDCEVGPFTHLRVGTVMEDGAEVGNFTEAKQARVGSGTKAKHLTYLGDVEIGAGANIGAGTIVANYDGSKKHKTVIGEGAFVGSGSVLIAPCTIGAGALTGGGAVITRNTEVPAGEAWVGVPARPLRRPKASSEEPTD